MDSSDLRRGHYRRKQPIVHFPVLQDLFDLIRRDRRPIRLHRLAMPTQQRQGARPVVVRFRAVWLLRCMPVRRRQSLFVFAVLNVPLREGNAVIVRHVPALYREPPCPSPPKNTVYALKNSPSAARSPARSKAARRLGRQRTLFRDVSRLEKELASAGAPAVR